MVAGATVIVTQNLKDFPDAALSPYGIHAESPDEFLICAYDLDPGAAMLKLVRHAEAVGLKVEEVLMRLQRTAPRFVRFVVEENGLEFGEAQEGGSEN